MEPRDIRTVDGPTSLYTQTGDYKYCREAHTLVDVDADERLESRYANYIRVKDRLTDEYVNFTLSVMKFIFSFLPQVS